MVFAVIYVQNLEFATDMSQSKKGITGDKSRGTAVLRNALNIFTDGSLLPYPRRGRIGIRFLTADEKGEEVVEEHCFPAYEQATDNQMELMACIKGLEFAGRCGVRPESLSRDASIFLSKRGQSGRMD